MGSHARPCSGRRTSARERPAVTPSQELRHGGSVRILSLAVAMGSPVVAALRGGTRAGWRLRRRCRGRPMPASGSSTCSSRASTSLNYRRHRAQSTSCGPGLSWLDMACLLAIGLYPTERCTNPHDRRFAVGGAELAGTALPWRVMPPLTTRRSDPCCAATKLTATSPSSWCRTTARSTAGRGHASHPAELQMPSLRRLEGASDPSGHERRARGGVPALRG